MNQEAMNMNWYYPQVYCEFLEIILEIEIFIMENISDHQPPPMKLRLALNGEPFEQQSSMAGVYSLQSSLVNGFPHWKHEASDNAIWLFGRWKVGHNENIGTGNADIHGPYNIEEWPNNISSKLQFFDGNKYQEAENGDIIFEDCSTKGNFIFLYNSTRLYNQEQNLYRFQRQHQEPKTHLLLNEKCLVSSSPRDDLIDIVYLTF